MLEWRGRNFVFFIFNRSFFWRPSSESDRDLSCEDSAIRFSFEHVSLWVPIARTPGQSRRQSDPIKRTRMTALRDWPGPSDAPDANLARVASVANALNWHNGTRINFPF